MINRLSRPIYDSFNFKIWKKNSMLKKNWKKIEKNLKKKFEKKF